MPEEQSAKEFFNANLEQRSLTELEMQHSGGVSTGIFLEHKKAKKYGDLRAEDVLTKAKAMTEHLSQEERNEWFDMEMEALKTT